MMGQDLPKERPSKSELREAMQRARAEAFVISPNAGFDLRDRFMESVALPSAGIIATYSARGDEIDPAPLTEALRAKGFQIALPVTGARDEPMTFRLYEAAAPFIVNAFGIREPEGTAPLVVPDMLLVPLIVFDQKCQRIGTGYGYYDRTIAHLRKTTAPSAVGLAFSVQQCPEIPAESHDVALDIVVTELQVLRPSSP